jgi:murein DD-endopeptidase MepM/ murein hydrolase activator NlpD
MWLDYQKQNTRWQSAQSELIELQNRQKKYNLENTSQQAQALDQKIKSLESFLEHKGVKIQPFVEYAGGPLDYEQQNFDLGWFKHQENHLDNLMKYIEHIPLGVPHSGTITSTFGYRANPFSGLGTEQHRGIDFKGQIGEPVYSTAHGKVTFSGWNSGYGYHVKIDHGNGYQTLYAHLSQTHVKEQQTISSGDLIGDVGNTGRSTGPHLHYEIHYEGQHQDPSTYIS